MPENLLVANLFAQLEVVEFVVGTLLGKKLGVASLLNELPIVQN